MQACDAGHVPECDEKRIRECNGNHNRVIAEGNERTCPEGRIHSIESFGTVDGPGVRFVVFFQGCPLRCLYCHNPDTWNPSGGRHVTVKELLELYDRNREFYRTGGITATGGEPLLQLPFLTELFRQAKERQIHTCLDTSGAVFDSGQERVYEGLFNCLDLVLLDFKHSDPQGHLKLTGKPSDSVLAFARVLEKREIPIIARHVLVPGYTDDPGQLRNLGKLLAGFSNLKQVEVLPYHTMGKEKYERIGVKYRIPNVPEASAARAEEAKKLILHVIKERRLNSSTLPAP